MNSNFRCSMMDALVESRHPFQKVYDALWKKPLDLMLRDVVTPAEKGLKYVPSDILETLGLFHMMFREYVLLIRDEYITAFCTLHSWSSGNQSGLGGVVVTGQPGIGAYHRWIAY
jgi:hypothetical protein